jgi:transcriptional regulator with XRE-family HTH domain
MAHLYDVKDIPDDFEMDREFGGVLKLLRNRAHFSIQDVSILCHIEESRLLSLESGHCVPSIMPREALMLATIYMVELDHLVALLK